MAHARRREERGRLVDQATLVWKVFEGNLTGWHLAEYIRCGALPAVDASRLPYMPEVELHMAKIQAAGRFVMPE